MEFSQLKKIFYERSIPSNTVVCITELSEAVIDPREPILTFLDRFKGIPGRGRLTKDVLLAITLKALSGDMANRLAICPEGITWDTIYKSCGVWDSTDEGEAKCLNS